jgi:indolepyruvate ferredoxin oxidoreductase
LTEYQNSAYASRYRGLVSKVLEKERSEEWMDGRLVLAVAKYFFKLMAYKDEYEVARLYSTKDFVNSLKETFDGDFKLEFHMAPPLLQRRDKLTGRYPKRLFGAWIIPVFKVLSTLKFLRGGPLDPFGYASHRKMERDLIVNYEQQIDNLLNNINPKNYEVAVDIASLPEQIRGYDIVKDESIAGVKKHEKTLFAQFNKSPDSQAKDERITVLEV